MGQFIPTEITHLRAAKIPDQSQWPKVPIAILREVFKCLDTASLFKCGAVCREWRRYSKMDSVWMPRVSKEYGKIVNIKRGARNYYARMKKWVTRDSIRRMSWDPNKQNVRTSILKL